MNPRSLARRVLALVAVTSIAIPAETTGASSAPAAQLAVDCVPASDSCWPAAFAFTPKGRELFYLERFTGEIHRVVLKTGRDTLWGQVGPVNASGERGALGLAIDPKWDTGKAKKRRKNRWVYVFYTNASPLENRIARLRKKRGSNGTREQRLATISIDGPTNHNGGVIHIGPDGKLYAVTGDQAANPNRAQNPTDPAGKVLRMNRGGGRPADNPIANSLALSYGHRNSFGFTFDPQTGRLWQTENGPECDDEINLITPGGNYGWGSDSDCPNTSTQGPAPIQPEREYTPAIVPTGAAFCSGCGLGAEVEGQLLVAFFDDGTIRRYSLDGERDDITGEAVLYDHAGFVLAVERRPNGQIYFSDEDGIYRLNAS